MPAGTLDWVGKQFVNAPLGNTARSRRLGKVAEAFAAGGADACATFTSVLDHSADSKGAYRLFDRPEVTHPNVLEDHCNQVRQQLREPGIYLLIEDTTAASLPGLKQARGLGPIGENYTRGFFLHTTLAVKWDPLTGHKQVLGMVGQQAWARPRQRPARRKSNGRGKESNNARQKRQDRESKRWAKMAVLAAAEATAASQLIYVADRESDIYEVFLACRDAGLSQVIRLSYSRALVQPEAGDQQEQEQKYLKDAAYAGEVRGRHSIHIDSQKRTAKLEIRSVEVELRGPARPGGCLEDLRCNVVYLKEVDVPEGCQAVEWLLLTDLPVETMEQCLHVVTIYCGRWLIEEFHECLKGGVKLESSQLSDGRRLQALAGVLSVVACFLLNMKLMARHAPQGEVKFGWMGVSEALVRVLEERYPPEEGRTWRWLWMSIAKRGGFMARKGDGDPGWLVLWRGWQRLLPEVRGYELGRAEKGGER